MSSKLDVALEKEHVRLSKVAKKLIPHMDRLSLDVYKDTVCGKYIFVWRDDNIMYSMNCYRLTTKQIINKMKQELGKAKPVFDEDLPF